MSICVTWYPTQRKEQTLHMFGNRELSIIFGSMMEKMREGWRKLHNENSLFTNCYHGKEINRGWNGQSRHHASGMKYTYRILVIKSEGKKPLRMPKYGRKDNTKMDLILFMVYSIKKTTQTSKGFLRNGSLLSAVLIHHYNIFKGVTEVLSSHPPGETEESKKPHSRQVVCCKDFWILDRIITIIIISHH